MRKLRRCVNWQMALKQKGVKQRLGVIISLNWPPAHSDRVFTCCFMGKRVREYLMFHFRSYSIDVLTGFKSSGMQRFVARKLFPTFPRIVTPSSWKVTQSRENCLTLEDEGATIHSKRRAPNTQRHSVTSQEIWIQSSVQPWACRTNVWN